MMLRRVVAVACFLLATLVTHSPAVRVASAEEGFRSLFNGQDLTGWVAVNTAPSTWTVQKGMLVCSGKPIGELRTDRMYQNFILELEWRHMVPRGNAGVFVWADDITARGVPFHRSIEVQVLDTNHGDVFPIHGARMTPINGRGRGSRAFPTEKRSKPSPEWNHYRITCQDGKISLAVNASVVTRGTDCNPRKGYICLESEGGIVHYRNIRIKELQATPIDPEDVALVDRGFHSLYTGLDLSGWKATPEILSFWHARDWRLVFDDVASDGDKGIATTQSWGDIGFIVDIRLSADSRTPRILLRGSDNASIALDPSDALLAPHLASARQWNRLEGTLRGDRLTLILNGHELFRDKLVSGVPERGPLKLSPQGPVEFANIYVRDLTNSRD